MNKEKSLSEGEALLLLVRRSGKTGVEVAKMLNIHPNHLSKLFKSERLTLKIKRLAAEVFNVPMSTFGVNNSDEMAVPDMVGEPVVRYERAKGVEEMTAAEVLRYLEEKDKRHFEERARLLGIIENLTKK